MIKDMTIAINNQVELFKNQLDPVTPKQGEYFIPYIEFDGNGAPEAMLSRLLTILTMTFHGYTWQQSYSFDRNVKGVLIRWIPKR